VQCDHGAMSRRSDGRAARTAGGDVGLTHCFVPCFSLSLLLQTPMSFASRRVFASLDFLISLPFLGPGPSARASASFSGADTRGYTRQYLLVPVCVRHKYHASTGNASRRDPVTHPNGGTRPARPRFPSMTGPSAMHICFGFVTLVVIGVKAVDGSGVGPPVLMLR